MVAKTQFAITGEDTRYFLNGAQFVLRPDSMSLVATDGHRLALVTRAARRQGQEGRRRRSRRFCRRRRSASSRAADRRRRRHQLRARREPPVLRRRRPAADLADDRRPVSRLRARDPEGQRQAHRVRARSADECRQARGAAVERAVARSEVPDRQGQGRRHLEQPGARRSAETLPVDYTGALDADLFQRAVRARFSRRRRRPTSCRSI